MQCWLREAVSIYLVISAATCLADEATSASSSSNSNTSSTSKPQVPETAHVHFTVQKPEIVGSYLSSQRLGTGPYKIQDDGSYFASSDFKEIGKGTPSNLLTYCIEGKLTSVERLGLTLVVSNPAAKKQAHSALIKATSALAQSALGRALPRVIRNALDEGKSGQWKNGDAVYKVHTQDHTGTATGYSISVILE